MVYICLSYTINKTMVTDPSVNDTKFRNFIRFIGNKMINMSRGIVAVSINWDN